MDATYLYDAENRIKTTAGVTYTYNGDGERVMKSNGMLYWGGGEGGPLSESDLTGNIQHEYIFFGGKRMARIDLRTAACTTTSPITWVRLRRLAHLYVLCKGGNDKVYSSQLFLPRIRKLVSCPITPRAITARTICILLIAAAIVASLGLRVRSGAICFSRSSKK